MAKFKTVADVRRAFRERANGGNTLEKHQGFRYEDIDKLEPVVEQLLQVDYNKFSGYSTSEIFEAISYLQTSLGTRDYLTDCRNNGVRVSEALYEGEDLSQKSDNFFSTVSEAFEGTTAQQAPYPVPSISFVTYRYEKSVLPFLCHLFDLKGNRGLIYFQRVTSVNAQGNITAGDLLANPKEFPEQPVGYATTKIINEEVGTLTNASADFTGTLDHVPQPGTLIITIDGHTGYFQDFQANLAKSDEVVLTPVAENLGYATFKFSTKALTIKLATAAAAENLKVRATYNRDVETVEGGQLRQAELTMDVEAKHLVAENVSIFTKSNVYQEQLARAIFGLDWNSELDRMLGMIYNKEMANKVVSEIRAQIPAANIVTHDITATLAQLDTDTPVGAGSGDNKLFNTQFLALVLGVLKKRIVKASGIHANRFSTLVANIDMLPVLEALPKYTPSTISHEDQMGGMFLGGLYDGIPVVYAFEPIVAENEIIGLYKSQTQDFLTPYALGTFMDPIVREVYDQNNLAIQRKQLMATIGGDVIANTLTAKLIVNNVDKLLGVEENNP